MKTADQYPSWTQKQEVQTERHLKGNTIVFIYNQ